MPIRKGHERLQVSFPSELKKALNIKANEQGISFQKLLIRICENYVHPSGNRDMVSKDETLEVIMELYETAMCLDAYQRRFLLTYLEQLKEVSAAIQKINISQK